MKPIRVLLVEDSPTVIERLRQIIDADPRLEVVGAVKTAEEALRVLHRLSPDVISMDIRLPGMNGFEATQRIMAEKPTPIVVVSASIAAEDLNITMNALRAGALSVVEKPTGTTHQDYQSMAEHICTQLTIMSEVKVVRQRTSRRLQQQASRVLPALPDLPAGPFDMLGLVASTGGPNALLKVLTTLGASFPLPILMVQHMGATFLDGFVAWLDAQCPFTVRLARQGEVPRPGTVYVPPGDRHLELSATGLHLGAGAEVDGQRPSGTVLFRSMARHLGPRGLGVLLTGMGADGAEGLLDLRRAGGYTMAEDASTAVVYGMPGEAVARGAVCESLPLPEVAPRLLSLASRPKETV